MNLFRRKAPVASVSLADQARSFVDCFDRQKAETVDEARKKLSRLNAVIADGERARDVLAAYLDRETAIIEAGTVKALEQASADIEAAMDEIELGSPEPEYDAADDGRKSYDLDVETKRKRGDKHWPKRASEKQLAAAE